MRNSVRRRILRREFLAHFNSWLFWVRCRLKLHHRVRQLFLLNECEIALFGMVLYCGVHAAPILARFTARDKAERAQRRVLFRVLGKRLGVTLRAKVAEWSANSAMCALTEKVIFDDPYIECRHNRWTSPQLDAFSRAIRSSPELKVAAALLKGKFLSCTQALLHGDLHTGSVMASEKTTYVIDPEFAFYGPMGFDVGALLSNLLLSYFSQAATNGADYAEWVLEQTVILHQTFAAGFLELWSESLRQAEAGVAGAGDGVHFKAAVFDTARSVERAQAALMQTLWYDSLGFAGVKMIRRIVGLAHVADLEDSHDADKRSDCEKRALLLGTELVLVSQAQQGLSCVLQLADRARQVYAGSTPQSLV